MKLTFIKNQLNTVKSGTRLSVSLGYITILKMFNINLNNLKDVLILLQDECNVVYEFIYTNASWYSKNIEYLLGYFGEVRAYFCTPTALLDDYIKLIS